jgi:predicted S18 family serine protease
MWRRKTKEQHPQSDADSGIDGRVAPAVALLLLGQNVYSQDDTTTLDDDGAVIPEPSALALLAAGAAVGGAVKYLRDKRRDK